jgi:hypothetical protein
VRIEPLEWAAVRFARSRMLTKLRERMKEIKRTGVRKIWGG